MSHHCHDEHIAHTQGSGGNGGHDHPHTHQHEAAPIPTNVSQSLNSKINTVNLTAFNLSTNESELPKLFKTQVSKNEIEPVFKSDADSQLILRIPFDEVSVKLYSVILRTSSNGDHCPKSVKFYKNFDNLDFDSIGSTKPTFTVEHPEIGIDDSSSITTTTRLGENGQLVQDLVDDNTFVEHFLPRHLFSGVNNLTIFFENNWTDDEDEVIHLYSIELRGEFKQLTRDPIVTLYESAANPADHKNVLTEENRNFHSV